VPNWLRRILPRVSNENTHFHIAINHLDHENVELIPLLKRSPGNLGTRQLFMVCHTCNTGWMRDLQDEVRPGLAPLIKGMWDSFEADFASRLAVWVAMTASVIAMSYEATQGVTRADREFIGQNKAVPEGWTIWIGRVSGNPEIVYSNRVAAVGNTSQNVVDLEANATVTTIALGQLLLHAVNAPIETVPVDPVVYADYFGVLPFHPWCGHIYDWRYIPIMGMGSTEFEALKNEFYMRAFIR
jgi:hypothetical protein